MDEDHRVTSRERCSPLPACLATGLGLLFIATTVLGDGPRSQSADPPPTLSIFDARVAEGDSGMAHLVLTLRLSAPPGDLVTCNFTTVDGTATAADGDFESTSGQQAFTAYDTVATIEVRVQGDALIEGNEWFLVRLSDPVGCVFADSEAVGTITNDERPSFAYRRICSTDYRDGTLPSALCDYNQDGFLDIPLFLGGPARSFTEAPGFRPLLAQGNYHGASSCDYDRDGDVDMVILGYTIDERLTPNLLLQNQGDGTFLNLAPQLGMAISGNGETAVWGDFDGDGWPDLFAPFYTDVNPYQSFLYCNNGDGTFTERASEAGISVPGVPWELRPEGAHAADWDDDGDLDIYCAGHLFINDGTATFVDVREAVGLPAVFDEGSSFVDFDNDGDLDLYLRCVASPRLFRNDAGHFTEVTAQAGITGVPLLWGDSWADADNDGDMDLMQHGGRARLLLNQGDGTFLRDPDFETVSSTQELSAWGDIDGDGDLDVIVGTMGKELLVNWLNLKPGFAASRFRVRVLDAEGRETAHGATVRLRQLNGGPAPIQTRVVDGGSGYVSQNEYPVQFGGIGSGRYALEVVYPSPAGTRVVVDSLANPVLGSLEASQFASGEITIYRDGRVTFSSEQTLDVQAPVVRPDTPHRLGAPFPSPAHRSVAIPVGLGSPGRASLSIHDLRGRLLCDRDLGTLGPGRHSVDWDLRDDRGVPAATGIYFCRLVVDGVPSDSRRILVVR